MKNDAMEQGAARWHLRLLGGFEVRNGTGVVHLSPPHQRLVVAVALRRLTRDLVVQLLWPDVDEIKAHARLRTAMWRLRKACPELVETSGDDLRLGSNVVVDMFDIAAGLNTRRFDDGWPGSDRQLGWELLPGWDDDWVVVERERCRQLVLHVLEAQARTSLERRDHAAALNTALSVLRESPLRDSAYRLMIEAHLSEGNANEAIRVYQGYRSLLAAELGLEPSVEIRAVLLDRGIKIAT